MVGRQNTTVCESAACGHYPKHTRRSSCVSKCVLFGTFLLVGFNTQGVPCCLLFFCFVSLSVFRLVVEIVALRNFHQVSFSEGLPL